MKHLILALLLNSFLGGQPALADPFTPPGTEDPKLQAAAQAVDPSGVPYCPEGMGLLNSSVLRSAGEMALKIQPNPGLPLRLTVCPTNGKPVVFRLYQKDGAFHLSIRRLSGLGGYELGHTELSGDILVDGIPANSLAEKLSSARLSPLFNLSKDDRDSMATFGGVSWSLEVVAGNNLKVIDVIAGGSLETLQQGLTYSKEPSVSPETMSAFIDICKTIYTLSGLDPGTLISN